jgi:hypothetical protein
MDYIAIYRDAWNATKKPDQPEYDNLIEEYRNLLSQRAAGAMNGQITDGPFGAFEGRIYDLTRPKSQSEPERVDDEPEEHTTDAEKEHLELKGKLPEDFPSHAKLHEAGINTYGQLNKVEDLTTIEGIGPATAKAIKKRLKADAKTLNK